VINVEGRQFQVTTHFNRRTPDDYVKEAFMKTVKIHKKLPPGDLLIFLTGKQEIEALCQKLREKLPPTQRHDVRVKENHQAKLDKRDQRDESEEEKNEKSEEESGGEDVFDEIMNSDDEEGERLYENDGSMEDDASSDENTKEKKKKRSGETPWLKVRVLPLYANLPPHQQMEASACALCALLSVECTGVSFVRR
jgi:ATP-dependent RNA helicase DHX37/DHR1